MNLNGVMIMKAILDKIRDTKAGVEATAWRLENLARSFRDVGNESVTDRLEYEIENLRTSIAGLSSSWQSDMYSQIEHSRVMMNNILLATINTNRLLDSIDTDIQR